MKTQVSTWLQWENVYRVYDLTERESMYRGNDLTERVGIEEMTSLWDIDEYRRKTEEDPALRLVGQQGRVCLEQMWFPSMSPNMTL